MISISLTYYILSDNMQISKNAMQKSKDIFFSTASSVMPDPNIPIPQCPDAKPINGTFISGGICIYTPFSHIPFSMAERKFFPVEVGHKFGFSKNFSISGCGKISGVG